MTSTDGTISDKWSASRRPGERASWEACRLRQPTRPALRRWLVCVQCSDRRHDSDALSCLISRRRKAAAPPRQTVRQQLHQQYGLSLRQWSSVVTLHRSKLQRPPTVSHSEYLLRVPHHPHDWREGVLPAAPADQRDAHGRATLRMRLELPTANGRGLTRSREPPARHPCHRRRLLEHPSRVPVRRPRQPHLHSL